MIRIKRWMTAVTMLVALALIPLPAQAVDGDGDGSGGGQNNPLIIESATPADGTIGVTNLEYIKIVFNKNVAYMSVRDKNLQCVSLWSGSQRVPADIIIADDQVEREKRNDVLVKPRQTLKAGTAYRVEIAPEMQSKSGVTLGKKATINFTMAGGTKTPETVTPDKGQPAAPDTITGNQSDAGTAQTAATTNPGPAGTVAGNPTDTATTTPAAADSQPEATSPVGSNSSNAWLWIALGAAVLATAVVVYRRMGAKN